MCNDAIKGGCCHNVYAASAAHVHTCPVCSVKQPVLAGSLHDGEAREGSRLCCWHASTHSMFAIVPWEGPHSAVGCMDVHVTMVDCCISWPQKAVSKSDAVSSVAALVGATGATAQTLLVAPATTSPSCSSPFVASTPPLPCSCWRQPPPACALVPTCSPCTCTTTCCCRCSLGICCTTIWSTCTCCWAAHSASSWQW